MTQPPLHQRILGHLKQHALKYGTGAIIGASGIGGVSQAPIVQNVVNSVLPQSSATCQISGMLPDQTCTPGVTNPSITPTNYKDTLCNPNWSTRSIRPPATYTTQLKITQIKEYGYSDSKVGDYEEDHLISLELGGNPTDPANLWPEPHRGTPLAGTYGSQDKDQVENAAHAALCAGTMTLAEVQDGIANNWVDLGIKLGVLH